MIRSFKHILIYSLIGLLLFNTGGSLIYFKLKEEAIEASAKKAIAEHKFHTNDICRFDANKPGLEWEESDEIKVDGQYYDVLYTETSHAGSYIYCIADNNETSLYNWYTNFIEDDSGNDNNIEDFILAVKWYTQQTITIAFTQKQIRVVITPYTDAEIAAYAQVTYPPPKQLPVV